MNVRPFSPDVIFSSIPVLLPFLLVTLEVGISSILLGSCLGFLLAWAKTAGRPWIRGATEIYTYTIRCTPSIVLLFVVFYGIPRLWESWFGVDMNDWSRSVFVVITFTLLFGGYISEVFRAAWQAVGTEQTEAAVSVGLSERQAFFHIVLPQAAVVALPNFGNSVINLLKESALAYTIGLIDLIGKGNLMIAQNFGAYGIEIYIACLLIYWGMNIMIEKIFFSVETYLSKGNPAGRT